MSITHTHKLTVTSGSDTVSATVATVTADTEVSFDASLAIGTNVEVDVTIDVSAIKSLIIVASTAMTLKTNSSGSPDQSISLAAGVAVAWKTGDLASCPLTTDITKIYVTNAAAGTLKIRCLLDGTP